MRHWKASAEVIEDRWFIGLKIAQATIGATTQRGVRLDILPLARRYKADKHFSMRRINARFATDIVLDVKSLNQNICAQIFHTRSIPTQHIQWYCWQGTLWNIFIDTFVMILGYPRIWCLTVILHKLDGTLYSWRLSGSITHSTTYQVLAGRMSILRGYQPDNWIRDGTALCTRRNFRSGYGTMDWYVSVKLETYLYLYHAMQVVERL